MIQRQFEFPDGDVCHFESDIENLIEHCKAETVTLSKKALRISYGKLQRRDVEIKFDLRSTEFQELASTLREMIPETKVEV